MKGTRVSGVHYAVLAAVADEQRQRSGLPAPWHLIPIALGASKADAVQGVSRTGDELVDRGLLVRGKDAAGRACASLTGEGFLALEASEASATPVPPETPTVGGPVLLSDPAVGPLFTVGDYATVSVARGPDPADLVLLTAYAAECCSGRLADLLSRPDLASMSDELADLRRVADAVARVGAALDRPS